MRVAVWQVFAVGGGVHASFPGCKEPSELGFATDFEEEFGAEFADNLVGRGEWLEEAVRMKGGVK